jgi:alpha-D-xyloside xylohydrolase
MCYIFYHYIAPLLGVGAFKQKKMKHLKTWIFLCIVTFLLGGCSGMQNAGYQKKPDGIIVKTDKEQIKLEVFSEEIIGVTATHLDNFPSYQSIMVEAKNKKQVEWTVSEKGNNIILATPKIKASVDKTTGQVVFLDTKDQPILQEMQGGRSFTPTEELGEKTFKVQQQFSAKEVDLIYGLGDQHNRVVNFKGQDAELAQYNIIDVNTFFMTNKNFGVLWDNNSITKFGDPRDYQPIAKLKLYNVKGEEGGLTAEYFKDDAFKALLTTRQEKEIAYEFLESMGSKPADFEMGKGSIRWTGEFASEVDGLHKFREYGSSYIKVWIDDQLIIDKWRQNWMPWTNLFEVDMKAGEKHKIKVEWIPNSGYIALSYLTPEANDLDEKITLTSEVGEQVKYYFVYGESADAITQNYRLLTGQAPMMPKWVMGLWQSRQRYKTQEELVGVVKEFRKRKIPLDNIVLDWFYWQEDQWGSHEFDKERFPKPDEMVKELHDDLNARLMISVWPKFYVGTEHYKEFEAKGWLVGKGYHSTFYDAFDEGARKLFWNQINEHLFSKGIDAWWLDATEPDLHSNTSVLERKMRMHPTALGSGARNYNAFSIYNAKGIYEGQRESDPNKRVFILTRSSFAGQQRYGAATWSGDVAARWEDLKNQIPCGINFCAAGIPYWTTDIGGFSVESRYEKQDPAHVEEFRELMMRWYQFGAFCPLFRVHGEFPYREIYEVAPENHPVYQGMLKYDKLRYRLMPYLYSLAGKVSHEGYTMMRGLAMDFPQDKKVFNIGDQFMFGSILVCPVTDFKARKRAVYLPANTSWYDFHTGEMLAGGKSIEADAPITDLPLYIKGGSILLFGPDIEYIDQKPADQIEVRIYQGADRKFSLYEDEGINYNYEKGKMAWIPFQWNDKTKTLTIEARKGEFDGMLQERTFNIVLVKGKQGAGFELSKKADKVVKYKGAKVEVKF